MKRMVFLSAALAAMTSTARAEPAVRQGQAQPSRPRFSGPIAPITKPVALQGQAQPGQRLFRVEPGETVRVRQPPAVAIEKRFRWLEAEVRGDHDGYPAAFQELFLKNASNAVTVKPGDYGQQKNGGYADSPQVVKVSGVPNGVLEMTHFGTVSTHDLFNETTEKFNEAKFKERVNDDRVAISYDYGAGTQRQRLVNLGLGGVVAKNDLKVPLNPKGITRIIYERQNTAGVVVGGTGGYTMGREVHLEWDGK